MERKKKYDKKEEVKVGREEQVDNKDSSAVKKTTHFNPVSTSDHTGYLCVVD